MNTSKDSDLKWMTLAIKEAAHCVSEPDKNSPAVGVVFVKGDKLLAAAHRGERKMGEHAEYTAIEHKLSDEDLAGSTVYTTLEPCTTRNHPKIPCADHLINKAISEVVVGMLDPDLRIYNCGCEKLKASGIAVRYFPLELRTEIEDLNRPFIEKFCANPESCGRASFDYNNNNGVYTIGHGDYLFETSWSKGSDTSIHLYNDPKSISRIAVAKGATQFTDVIDAGIYNFSSRARTLSEGEIAVVQNRKGYYALLKIMDVFDCDRPPDDRDELIFEYKILSDGTSDFSGRNDLVSSDPL